MKDLSAETLRDQLEIGGLISPGDKVYIACSGGPDSTALFHLLYSIRKEWKLKLGLLHFNHGLRKVTAARDERFVRKLADSFRVPFYRGVLNVASLARREKFSTEEAARLARYTFFEKIAVQKRILKIATAHTLDDQAETILMRVLQGTGLRGLCGIRPLLRRGDLSFVRPLLSFKKQEISNYLKKNRRAFCIDSSNASLEFLRNRVRLKLIPWLAETFQPRAVEAIARIPAILSEDAEFLEEAVDHRWRRVCLSQKQNQINFSRTLFLKAAPSLQFRMIDRGLRALDSKSGFSFDAWQTLRQILSRPRGRCSLPKNIDFILTPSRIMLYKK